MLYPARACTSRHDERALVIGGNGFVGSHLVDALLASGRSVRVLAPRPERFRPPIPGVEYVTGRLDRNADAGRFIDGCNIVVDAATTVFPASADASPADALADGIGMSARLAELCRAIPSVTTLVYLSSGGTVYGRGNADHRPSTEADPLAPIGTYGAMKAGAELAISALLDSSPIRPVFLRVANAYGDRQDPARPQGIIPVAFDRVRSDRPLTIYGDTVRDFIHVRDVATALVTAVDGPVRGPLNVGSGIGISVSQLLIMIEEVAKKRPHVEQLPLRDFDVPHAVLDITRLRSLGWTPATDLDDGLRQTWRWLETTAQGGLVRPPSHRLND